MNQLIVASSPHLHTKINTSKTMLCVIIALIPAFLASIYLFGFRALLLIAVTVISAVASEYIFEKVTKRKNTINDFSAAITGLLLAFSFPPSLPLWIAVIGAVTAIVVVKQMFGGIGYNFANPAITARIILMVSFPARMTEFDPPSNGFANFFNPDAVASATSSATPLGQLESLGKYTDSYLDMILGVRAGSIGETCTIALLLGGIFLVCFKIISPVIPLTFVGTVFVLSFLLGLDPFMQILSGGLVIGAIFMATDYVTSPITLKGKFIFSLGCGILTVLIRKFAALPEGVSYSILLMNILTPHIDNLCRPKTYGGGEKK
jgi:electron transport complex, RnfABCDGE type, D subunit